MAVRKFARVKNRVESGAVQFGDDWPGLYLRGDDAKFLSMAIDCLLESIPVTKTNGLAVLHLQETKAMIEDEVNQSVEPNKS